MSGSEHLNRELTTELAELLADAVDQGQPSAATAVVLHHGRVVGRAAAGSLASHDDTGAEIPRAEREPVTDDTWFDLASITKIFSAITLHTLVEQGVLSHNQTVASVLPQWRGDDDRERVTLRHLLTHLSGLPAMDTSWRAPMERWHDEHPDDQAVEWPLDDIDERRAELAATPLEDAPLSTWRYSCVGYNTAMLMAEAATGRSWDELVTELALRPLDVAVDFTPGGPVAATELESDLGRGVVRGQVHDEFSWSLGGRTANAGLFGTAAGVATALDRLRTDDLPCSSISLWANQLPGLIGRDRADAAPWGHTMGLRIGQVSFMGQHSRQARGHTGFTGTSVITDRERALTVALLTNGVHPSREGSNSNPLRAEVAELAHRHLVE